jgi:hypothetical protein
MRSKKRRADCGFLEWPGSPDPQREGVAKTREVEDEHENELSISEFRFNSAPTIWTCDGVVSYLVAVQEWDTTGIRACPCLS